MGKQNMVYPYHGVPFSQKRNEVPIHGIAWMDLEEIMQSDSSWTHRTTYSSICVKSPEQANLYREHISGHLGLGWGRGLQGGPGTFLEWEKCSKTGPWQRLHNSENFWETTGSCTSNRCTLYPNKAVKKKKKQNQKQRGLTLAILALPPVLAGLYLQWKPFRGTQEGRLQGQKLP